MANFEYTVTEQSGNRDVTTKSSFISWTPYPQPTTKTTELINRIGSTETIVQTLYESSRPIGGVAVAFADTKAGIDTIQSSISKSVGLNGQLQDNINAITIKNLVLTDMMTQEKKVTGGWILVCTFTQHIKSKV